MWDWDSELLMALTEWIINLLLLSVAFIRYVPIRRIHVVFVYQNSEMILLVFFFWLLKHLIQLAGY